MAQSYNQPLETAYFSPFWYLKKNCIQCKKIIDGITHCPYCNSVLKNVFYAHEIDQFIKSYYSAAENRSVLEPYWSQIIEPPPIMTALYEYVMFQSNRAFLELQLKVYLPKIQHEFHEMSALYPDLETTIKLLLGRLEKIIENYTICFQGMQSQGKDNRIGNPFMVILQNYQESPSLDMKNQIEQAGHFFNLYYMINPSSLIQELKAKIIEAPDMKMVGMLLHQLHSIQITGNMMQESARVIFIKKRVAQPAPRPILLEFID